jgi:pre-mRNA-processing factor SLU7
LTKLLSKYGGEKHLNVPEEIKQHTKDKHYESIESTITAAKLSAPRMQGLIGNIASKYPENEFTDSHTAIWGSAYDLETGLWGYKCCLSYSQNPGQKCGGIPAR